MNTFARRALTLHVHYTVYTARVKPSVGFRYCSSANESSSRVENTRRRLDVAIVGAPNAGKSQLLNRLCQSNVAAVSRKRHTTRDGILGARTIGETQIVFCDTPGFLRPKSAQHEGLTRSLTYAAMEEMQHVDYTLVVIDSARKLTLDLKEALVKLMLKATNASGRVEGGGGGGPLEKVAGEKFAIVLNKVDLVKPKRNLLDVATEIGDMAEECIKHGSKLFGEETESDEVDMEALAKLFPPIFYVSALHDEDVDDILALLLRKATPSCEWALPADQVTLMSPLERVEEIVREKIYRCLHKEVPHHVQQMNRTFQVLQGDYKMLRVDQDLVVGTKSHFRLVLGQGGKTLRRIQETAKRDLERMFECPVMLNLQVKLSKSKQARITPN